MAWKVPACDAVAQAEPAEASRSSPAALRVKVTASTRLGSSVPVVGTRCAMRWVSTRVLPEPAPARMRSGEASDVTASQLRVVEPGEQPVALDRIDIAIVPAAHRRVGPN